MASFGDFLVASVIILAITIPLVSVAGYAMFGINASARGYDTNLDYNDDGCFEKYNDNGFVTSEFCKSDYGFLGWRSWWTADDVEFMKETITGMVDGDVEPDCAYGVSYFKQVEKDGELIYEYQCFIP